MRFGYVAILGLASATVSRADAPPFDAKSTVNVVSPYLDLQTFGVAHIQVGRLSPTAFEWLFDLQGVEAAKKAKQVAQAEQWKRMLQEAKIEDLFVVLSLDDLKMPYAWVVPKGSVETAAGMANLFNAISPSLIEGMETAIHEKVFLAGSPAMVRHLRSMQAQPRPELESALAAIADADVRLAVIPSADHRRTIDEMMPKLPTELGGGSTTVLTAGLSWAAAGMTFSPKLSINVVVQSRDERSAVALSDLQRRALTLVAKQTDDAQRPWIARLGLDAEMMMRTFALRHSGDRLTLRLDDASIRDGLKRAVAQAQVAALENERRNVLKQLALAMHNYDAAHGRFPARAGYGLTSTDAMIKKGIKYPDLTMKPKPDSKPLLSWRVYILPYIEQDHLYQRFKLDEPWDSENNKKLIPLMPALFRGTLPRENPGKTRFVVPVIKGGIFEPDGPGTLITEIFDGTSNTVLVVEAAADRAVIWTKPDDLDIDPKNPAKGLFNGEEASFLAALADGSVQSISKKLSPQTILHLILRADGNAIQWK